jgi:hypothetical protein
MKKKVSKKVKSTNINKNKNINKINININTGKSKRKNRKPKQPKQIYNGGVNTFTPLIQERRDPNENYRLNLLENKLNDLSPKYIQPENKIPITTEQIPNNIMIDNPIKTEIIDPFFPIKEEDIPLFNNRMEEENKLNNIIFNENLDKTKKYIPLTDNQYNKFVEEQNKDYYETPQKAVSFEDIFNETNEPSEIIKKNIYQ